MFTDCRNWYNTPVILPPVSRSDHCCVLLVACVNSKYQPTRVVRYRRCYDQNSKTLFADELRHVNWLPLYQAQSCCVMVDMFYTVMLQLIDYHFPVIESKQLSNDKPWVNDRFRQLIRTRQSAFRSGNVPLYNKYRNKVQRLAKRLQKQFYERKVQDLRTSNPRKWWSSVKKFLGSNRNIDLKHLSLHENIEDLNLADEINNFFANVAAGLQPLQSRSDFNLNDDYISDYVISLEEVERQLACVQVNKAPGPDGIPNWILRDMAPFISGPLCAIFNASVREGFVPPVWKQANTIPAPKVNPPKSLQSDLRPISLTPTLSKLLESFVGKWILNIIETTIDRRQFGALKGRSTTHALVSLLHSWSTVLDRGGSVRAVFVDYQKAFDRVDHNIVLHKLVQRNVPHFIIKWMFSFLEGRQQRVKINDRFSNWTQLFGGMIQGSWLGPLIFLLLIDDLQLDCLVHKFVDDTTLSELLSSGDHESHMKKYV